MHSGTRALIVPGIHAEHWCYSLGDGCHEVGRGNRCQLHLDHTSVSRRHAGLCCERGRITIRDHGSRNGTYIDGRRIVEDELHLGEQVTFGRVVLELIDPDGFRPDGQTNLVVSKGAAVEIAVPLAVCSSAQRRVLRLMMQGHSEKRIARELDFSAHTVHEHIKRIYKNFVVHSRAELMAILLSSKSMAGGATSDEASRGNQPVA
jgi:DNA-binding CsgD family transcriptional regulator